MIKKQICKIFAENNLKISIEANYKSTNFLDITMDLRTGEYKPYTIPNNTSTRIVTIHLASLKTFQKASAKDFLAFLRMNQPSTKQHLHIKRH